MMMRFFVDSVMKRLWLIGVFYLEIYDWLFSVFGY